MRWNVGCTCGMWNVLKELSTLFEDFADDLLTIFLLCSTVLKNKELFVVL